MPYNRNQEPFEKEKKFFCLRNHSFVAKFSYTFLNDNFLNIKGVFLSKYR